MSEVSVGASASAEFEPELARIQLTFSATDSARERGIDAVVTSNRTAEGWVQQTPGVVLKPPVLSTYRESDRRGRYTTTLRREAEFHGDATDLMAEFLGRVAAELAAGIDGPSWELTPDTAKQRRREVTKLSVGQAREQAEAYAEALGLRVGQLIRIGDPGGMHDARAITFGLNRSMGAMEKAGLGEVDFTPAPVTIYASTQATWELLPG